MTQPHHHCSYDPKGPEEDECQLVLTAAADAWDKRTPWLVPAQGDPFHIGQSYDEHPAQQMKCAACGGVNFHIGRGDCYTAVRCAGCRRELCVHEG